MDKISYIKHDKRITYIDFCSGIGGGRLGLESNGLHCIAFSEIDKKAEITYREMFDPSYSETNLNNLMDIDINKLPNFDLMIGGFPCQTFSIIGKREGLNREEGQVIYGLIEIIKRKNLKYFILENVKGLLSQDKGKTFKKIIKNLEDIGYKIYYKVLNSINFGVPQLRERIYIVGIRHDLFSTTEDFNFPIGSNDKINIRNFLCDESSVCIEEGSSQYKTFLQYLNNKYNKGLYSLEYILKQDYLVLDTRQSDLRIYKDKVPTLRKGRHGILYVKDNKLRKVSGYESLLLQGFPKSYALKVKNIINNNDLLSQAGNAMTVTVIAEIAKNFIEYLNK